MNGCLIKLLAWEPRVVIVSPTVYPRFVANYDFSYFPFKSEPTPKLRKFPWFYRIPRYKSEANRSRGLEVMIGQPNKDYRD